MNQIFCLFHSEVIDKAHMLPTCVIMVLNGQLPYETGTGLNAALKG
jgi:hypothetical protein